MNGSAVCGFNEFALNKAGLVTLGSTTNLITTTLEPILVLLYIPTSHRCLTNPFLFYQASLPTTIVCLFYNLEYLNDLICP